MRIGSISSVRRFPSRRIPLVSGGNSAELVVNGNFAQGMSGWTSIGGVTADTSGGTAKVGPTTNTGGFSQDISVPANSALDVRIVARKFAGAAATKVFASPSASYTGDMLVTSSSYQEFYWRITSTTGVIRLYLQVFSTDAVLDVQSASVRLA